MLKRILVVLALVLAGIGTVPTAAQADDYVELQSCESNWAQMGSAGYYRVTNGVEYAVYITVGWQYVGPSWSACEDINVSPNTGGGYYMTNAYARTYMCNSAGSCWYNAWRFCGGGCVAATDMVNGTRYQVHIQYLAPGTDYARLQD